MNHIFPAIFETVWKRKETKIFLAFSLYPFVYLVASFFGSSNFMQIASDNGVTIGYLDFMDMMLNSMDMLILPTLTIYFLTISVFKRETDDHTMFLYKDINRKKIFLSKYVSLICILFIFLGIFYVTSLLVHYGRVVYLDFGSARIESDSLYNTLIILLNSLVFILKGILAISISALLSLSFGTGATMVSAIFVTILMMITSVIGGPLAMVFPNGYNHLVTSVGKVWIGFIGPIFITTLYAVICNYLSLKKFRNLEF